MKLWRLTLSLPNVAKGKFRPNLQISFSKNFDKQIASCESTDRELSFEWSHHRILSIDSKVTVTLQNTIKHSGSERVKNCEEKGKLQDYMQNYSPHHRGTSEAHKFTSF